MPLPVGFAVAQNRGGTEFVAIAELRASLGYLQHGLANLLRANRSPDGCKEPVEQILAQMSLLFGWPDIIRTVGNDCELCAFRQGEQLAEKVISFLQRINV